MTADNHVYQYSFDPEGDSAGARVLKLIPKNTRVLELGAGPGSVTKHISRTLNCDVVAIEIDSTATTRLQQFASTIYSLDLNSSDWDDVIERAEGRFQTVLAADVLEHLYWPEVTLEKMKGLLSDDGSIVLSLPHVGHSAVVASLLDDDFEYRNTGLLDRTHIRFFGLKNIQSLHERAGLAIEEAYFVYRAPEVTELHDRWERMPNDVRKLLGNRQFGSVYQVVTRAVPKERATRSINLMSMDAGAQETSTCAQSESEAAREQIARPTADLQEVSARAQAEAEAAREQIARLTADLQEVSARAQAEAEAAHEHIARLTADLQEVSARAQAEAETARQETARIKQETESYRIKLEASQADLAAQKQEFDKVSSQMELRLRALSVEDTETWRDLVRT